MYRQRVRLEHLYKNKTRKEYVQLCKRMGIDDVCECEPFALISTKRRANSGVNGILECRECECIMYPLMYMYECDECTELTLAEVSFLPLTPAFYCEDCIYELN